jgi:hypothetical protein
MDEISKPVSSLAPANASNVTEIRLLVADRRRELAGAYQLAAINWTAVSIMCFAIWMSELGLSWGYVLLFVAFVAAATGANVWWSYAKWRRASMQLHNATL